MMLVLPQMQGWAVGLMVPMRLPQPEQGDMTLALIPSPGIGESGMNRSGFG